jgi:uncharacterized repeat protein (TIGR03987 family)
MLIIAITFIFLACVLYSLGVWAEKIQGRLKTWHMLIFWAGLLTDSIGTGAMGKISGSLFQFSFHGITGLVAIILMLFHAIWATIVLSQNNEIMIRKFHKFSFIVWIIWLVPMVSGMVFGASV